MDTTVPHVAVYWDFENVHASLCNLRLGEGWYRTNRYTKQPALVDVDAIMQFISGLGNVNINRAYANWNYLHAYSNDLQNHAIDLIQLFHRGSHGKNGADIRMAIDIIEDLEHNRHIGIVVVIGGDSDYVSVAQRVRQKGRRIVGIGVRETTNQYWIQSCNEFKYYASLMVKAHATRAPGAAEFESGSPEEAKELLRKALDLLTAQAGGAPIVKAALKPMMTRLEPSFDEANFGYRSFADFLEACPDVVVVSRGQYDHEVAPRRSPTVVAAARGTPARPSGRCAAVLRSQDVKLVPLPLLESAARVVLEMFSNGQSVATGALLKDALVQRLRQENSQIAESDVSKIKGLLYKAFVFRYDERGALLLADKIGSAADVLLAVRWMIVHRVVSNLEGLPDTTELSSLLFGDEAHQDEVQRFLDAYARARSTPEVALTPEAGVPSDADSAPPEPGPEAGPERSEMSHHAAT